MSLHQRKVTRVLVLLDYGPDDPQSGEVFDLTQLAIEMREHNEKSYGKIALYVNADRTYHRGPAEKYETNVQWSADFGANAGHLDDAINAAMPDGERVTDIKNAAKRLREQAEQLERDAAVAKLEQVASIRAQHPICRVTGSALAAAAPAPLALTGSEQK